MNNEYAFQSNRKKDIVSVLFEKKKKNILKK